MTTMFFATIVIGIGAALWCVSLLARMESTLITGMRIVPWREWLRRVRAHGRAWRSYL